MPLPSSSTPAPVALPSMNSLSDIRMVGNTIPPLRTASPQPTIESMPPPMTDDEATKWLSSWATKGYPCGICKHISEPVKLAQNVRPRTPTCLTLDVLSDAGGNLSKVPVNFVPRMYEVWRPRRWYVEYHSALQAYQ